MAGNEALLLTDEQMRTFITEGFLILKTDFPESFHKSLTAQLNNVYEEEGNPGNNLLPRIRELRKVFDHPVVTGALTSVLGPGYMLHTHRHGHYNAVDIPGNWHKDSYWGYDRIRNQHPWWAMIMYFPQDTPVELGPTGVMPGTHNYSTRTFASDSPQGEALASGAAGTFALIHYDIWHRSTSNLLGQPRYMLKFEFMRTAIPHKPSWNNREEQWTEPERLYPDIVRHERMWADTWNWLRGKTGSLANTLPEDAARILELGIQLKADSEPDAINAAYELASRGAGGVKELLSALRHEDVAVSRLAAYGLSASGSGAEAGLAGALDDAREETVAHAAFALGELRDYTADTARKLHALMADESAIVRRTVVEVLGMTDSHAEEAVSRLISGLADADVQVRFMAALSLARLGPAAEAAVPLLERALDDENRYVRGHAAEALRYIGTAEAKDILIKDLLNSRWCYTTTAENAFYP
jgi:HEAT repeat protein